MFRVFCVFLYLLVTAVAVSAQERALERAFSAMNAGEWDIALRVAEQDGLVARDVIEWHRLRASKGNVEDALAFLSRNSDWPGLPYLRKQSESMLEKASTQTVLDFFKNDGPQTGAGALAYALALRQVGHDNALGGAVKPYIIKYDIRGVPFPSNTGVAWQANK